MSRWAVVLAVAAALGLQVRPAFAAPAPSAPPAAAPAAPDVVAAPPAPPAGTGDVSRQECFVRHEGAQAARRERRLLKARADLQICSRAACPAIVRNDCVDWLDQVSRSLPSVVVTARARGADEVDVKVLVDGKPVAERLSGAALDVDPGEHRFRFESPRWPAIERTVLVSEGVKDRSIDVEFAPAPALAAPPPSREPPPPAMRLAAPERRFDRADYLLGGAALASVATSAYFGGWALLERNRLMSSCGSFCSTAEATDVHDKLVVADVALGVAAALLVVLWVRHARSATPAPAGSF